MAKRRQKDACKIFELSAGNLKIAKTAEPKMPEKPSTSWQKVRGTCTQRQQERGERGRKQSALAQKVATRSVVRNYCFCSVYGRVMYCVYK